MKINNQNADFFSIYYANVSNIEISANLRKLPQIRQEKANLLMLEKDKKLSIGSYLLLEKVAKNCGLSFDEVQLKYDENGKPFLDGCNLNISISHSGVYAVIAISSNPIGIDIQKIDQYNPKILGKICNQEDMNFYNNSSNKLDSFYKIWTAKESYIKMTGEGLKKPLKNVSVDYSNNGEFHFFNIINGYQICACVKNAINKENLELALMPLNIN